MEIIKQGNLNKEYKYICDVCGCEFKLTGEERARNGWATISCPCCGELIALASGAEILGE